MVTAARLTLQAWGALTGRGAAGRLAASFPMITLPLIALRAYGSALVALPGILRERWRQRSRRRLGTAEFRRLLDEFRLGVSEVALKE